MSLLEALNLPALASLRAHKHVANGGSSKASPARASTTNASNAHMPADGKAASSGGAGLATAAMANAAAERRYDLLIGRIQPKGATLIETVRALTGELQRLKGTFDAELQSHGERMRRGAESLSAAAVAMLSGRTGGCIS